MGKADEAPANAVASAVIVHFPSSGPVGEQMRLRRALAGLDRAMSEQRRAVAEWQTALADLRQAMGGLDGAMRAQDRVLGALASDVAGLNGEANRLLAWSDRVLSASV